MANWVFRWLKLGGFPKKELMLLKRERIVLSDEGINGAVVFHKAKGPGHYYYRKYSWTTASIALTRKRLVAFTFGRKMIDMPLDDPRFDQLEITLKSDKRLCIGFDPGLFRDRWSGRMECRFTTPKAKRFYEALKK